MILAFQIAFLSSEFNSNARHLRRAHGNLDGDKLHLHRRRLRCNEPDFASVTFRIEVVDTEISVIGLHSPVYEGERIAFTFMVTNAPFKEILVWKFSRFTCKREHAVAFKSMLRRKGIRVVSITKHADDSPTGKLMEAIIESMDEFYSEDLAQEVMRGMREAASEHGRGRRQRMLSGT